MAGPRLLRNWMWPTLAAALSGALTAYQQGCVALDCMVQPILVAAGAFLLTKFNAIGGKDQKWFSHDKGDYTGPHRA